MSFVRLLWMTITVSRRNAYRWLILPLLLLVTAGPENLCAKGDPWERESLLSMFPSLKSYSSKEATSYYFNPRPNRFNLELPATPPKPFFGEGRKSFFQKANAGLTWVPAGGRDGLGCTTFDISVTCALPCPTSHSPLLITPSLQTWWMDPKEDDFFGVSDTLATTGLSLFWMKPLGPKAILNIGASPGWSSDFKQDSDRALRVPFHLGVLWICNPRTKILFGIAYLDRSDYPVLPIGGITWEPSAEWLVEVGFPKTRISRQILKTTQLVQEGCGDLEGTALRGIGYWCYLGFEFGGGTWAVKRPDKVNDLLLYRDYRFMIGFERKIPHAFNWSIECGFLFSREIEYDSGYDKKSPEEMLFLRWRVSF